MHYSAKFSLTAALLILTLPATLRAAENSEWKVGNTLDLGAQKATLKKLDALPYVESEYSKRFKFDSFDNPKLKELRANYKLDDVVAAGKDEFDKQVLLMDWTHNRFKKFGKPSAKVMGALEILKAIDEGHTFFCAQYADVLASSAASLGWIDRTLALRRHQGVNKVGGSTEHSSTEIWSNQFGKWIVLDPTSDLYIEKNGVPLNAIEIRQEWFYTDGKELDFVFGKDRKHYKKSDLPIKLKHFDGFGDLSFEPDELDKYGFTAFVPNTNLMDAGPDYGKMFIVKDKLCDGTKWHERTVPANPLSDPYFPLDQAALKLAPEGSSIHIAIKTMTPNLKGIEVQVDGGGWKPSDADFRWSVHPGTNRLEARTVNLFGVAGPVSTGEVEVSK